MNKEKLIRNIAKSGNFTIKDTRKFIEVALGEIIKGVLKYDILILKEFGKFYKHTRKASLSNCSFKKIKGTYPVKESTTIKFKLSKTVKEFINPQ